MKKNKFFSSIKWLLYKLLVSISLSSTALSAPVCDDILKFNFDISSQTLNLMNALNAKPALIAAVLEPSQVKIGWYAFKDLNELRPAVEQYVLYLQTLSPQQLIAERRSLDQYLENNPATAQLFSQLAANQDFLYEPAQYKMRISLIKEIIKIVRLLPPEFRPSIAKPHFDKQRERINHEAVAFMQDYLKRFDELFDQDSGYPNYAALEADLRKSPLPFVRKALNLIDRNQVEVILRRPPEGRFWVPKVGFQNQFVTASSKGTYNPESRNRAEANLALSPHDTYAKLDSEIKPKYGTFKASSDANVLNRLVSSTLYGSDIYTLKLEEIADRLSFYMDDSLGDGEIAPIPNDNSSRVFIPWSRRLIMVPLLALAIENGSFDLPQINSIPFILKINELSSRRYWETQIFGQVTLDMVSSFQFNERPPEGEFLQELLKRKITIYDGRSGEPVLWRLPK